MTGKTLHKDAKDTARRTTAKGDSTQRRKETESPTWPHPRRLVLVRHRLADKDRAGGKKLIDVPGYLFEALVTSLTTSPLEVWRYFNGRADCENVIRELQSEFALGTLCRAAFWATEAALSLRERENRRQPIDINLRPPTWDVSVFGRFMAGHHWELGLARFALSCH